MREEKKKKKEGRKIDERGREREGKKEKKIRFFSSCNAPGNFSVEREGPSDLDVGGMLSSKS